MTTILITGCTRGLGLATVTHLLSLPPSHPTYPETLFATYRNEPSKGLSDLLISANGTTPQTAWLSNGTGANGNGVKKGRLVLVRLDDITSVEDVEEARDIVLEGLGKGGERGLDVLVNNAALMHRNEGAIPDLASNELLSLLATNVTGPHLVTKTFLPLLKRGTQKKIINMSSTLGSIHLSPQNAFNCEAYKISKAALNALTVEWACQLASAGTKRTAAGAEGRADAEIQNPEGWCVVAFSPGWLRTNLGGPHAEFPVEHGAEAVVDFVGSMEKSMNGRFVADDGSFPPW